MQKQKLILIGGGGHAKACIDVIEQADQYDILGILDRSDLINTSVLGYKIIGTDEDILKYVQDGCEFLITVGQIKTAKIRRRIFELLLQYKAPLATIISPRSCVSKYSKIERGTIVMHNAVVNAGAYIAENCILNTGCDIEHDAIIGPHTHISTYAVVNGDCNIGAEVFVGSNATISNQVNIGDEVILGSGAVVTKNINQKGTYVGSPVKKIS